MIKTIEYTESGVLEARVLLRRATVGDDMRKNMLISQALGTPLADPADQAAAVVMYPRCMACLVEGQLHFIGDETVDLKTLDAAGFVMLPAGLGDKWFEAALELNPSWSLNVPQAAQTEQAEKKDSK